MKCLPSNGAIESIYFSSDKSINIQELRLCGKDVNFSGTYLSPFNSIAYMMVMATGNRPEEPISTLKLNDVSLSGLDPAGRGKRTSRPCFLLGHLFRTPHFSRCLSLSLSGNDMSFPEVSALLEGLSSSTLQTLDLSRNRLDTKSSDLIVSTLAKGCLNNLERLELADNPALLSGPTSSASWGRNELLLPHPKTNSSVYITHFHFNTHI
jgi:hypothetical protein